MSGVIDNPDPDEAAPRVGASFARRGHADRSIDALPIEKVIVALAIAGGFAALAIWWMLGPGVEVVPRVPLDRTPRAPTSEVDVETPFTGVLTPGDGIAADVRASWPSFRGPRRDGTTYDGTALVRDWSGGDPARLWSVDVGEGYAGAAIANGCVYVLDYDRAAQADALRCLSLADGREVWRYTYPVRIKRNHGMSRTVPAVDGQYVVSVGPKCHVLCVDASTGAFRWIIDLVARHGATVPQWYAGQCPLIDDGQVILAPGGSSLLMAVDVATGAVRWRSPNPDGWEMTHSSIVPMTLDGRRAYVYCGSGGVVGVGADDGSVVWRTTRWKVSIAMVASPVIVPGNRIFLSGGYGAGSMMLQLRRGIDGYVVEPLFALAPGVFGATQHTPIVLGDHLYGVRPDGQLVCLDFDGTIRWSSGSAARFGLGPYLIANGLIYAMDDDGLLSLAEATPDAWRPLARARVLDGHESWGPMAMAAGRLVVRDFTTMTCLAVGR